MRGTIKIRCCELGLYDVQEDTNGYSMLVCYRACSPSLLARKWSCHNLWTPQQPEEPRPYINKGLWGPFTHPLSPHVGLRCPGCLRKHTNNCRVQRSAAVRALPRELRCRRWAQMRQLSWVSFLRRGSESWMPQVEALNNGWCVSESEKTSLNPDD